MKVQELMERVGSQETGRMIAYIKDGLEEINMISETHVDTVTIDITEGQRFYKFPDDMVKILDIRCKNHQNTSDLYQSIPRSIYKPEIEDADGN